MSIADEAGQPALFLTSTMYRQAVKCTVFLADIKEWREFNEVYREYFESNPPARSALAASGLAFNARSESSLPEIGHPMVPAPALPSVDSAGR